MKSHFIKLSDKVKIRKEHFGGILFDMDTGDVIEVDREAFTVISIIKDIEVVDIKALLDMPVTYRGKRVNRESIESVLSRFADLGVIDIMPNGILSEDWNKMLEEKSFIKIKWPIYEHLSAPETIHWAVTYQCNELCPDCYIERHKRLFTNELDTLGAYKLVDKIAANGVFQLAIGGGEPFMRNDLEDIARRASEKGLVVHITTGRHEIEQKRLDALAKHIKTLQTGIRTEELLRVDKSAEKKLGRLVTQLAEHNIITGANLFMTRYSIYNFDSIVEMILHCGFKRVTLLRYKPPANIRRWLQEKPDKHDLELLEEKLAAMQEMDISFRIDCALSFMERRLNPQIALYSGIRGCVAGERIISVAPDGSVYPCSQLVGDIFKAGNLLNEDFECIWNKSNVIKKYRDFRQTKAFKNSNCGKCRAKDFCGGCRVFADDAIGYDPGCCKLCANREETEEWLEDEHNRNYPLWINNTMEKTYRRRLNENNKY